MLEQLAGRGLESLPAVVAERLPSPWDLVDLFWLAGRVAGPLPTPEAIFASTLALRVAILDLGDFDLPFGPPAGGAGVYADCAPRLARLLGAAVRYHFHDPNTLRLAVRLARFHWGPKAICGALPAATLAGYPPFALDEEKLDLVLSCLASVGTRVPPEERSSVVASVRLSYSDLGAPSLGDTTLEKIAFHLFTP
jgi:hypothetical protein